MLTKQIIESIVRTRDFSLTTLDVELKTTDIFNDIENNSFNFSKYDKKIFTQQSKKRFIFSYEKLSCEDILCQYLKKKLDSVFKIKYASRSRIINLLFNILPVVKDMNDFVIIRADFKSFFDSVLTRHVFDKYILESPLKRYDKELLDLYSHVFKYCYAGLCLSNGLTEIVCRDFDECLKAKFSQNGLFFYERYVDDIILVMNKYIHKETFFSIVNSTIKEVFGNSPVRLSTAQDKFSYIAKRNVTSNSSQSISFLGYKFVLNFDNSPEKKLSFSYGITENKLKKYSRIIESAVIKYSKDRNLELLRQRIKLYSSRVVIGRTIGSSSYDWLTKGVIANYNELRFHLDSLTTDTENFFRDLYFYLFKKHGIALPYFMKQSLNNKEESIYNLQSNIRRNRTIIFHERIGVSRKTLVKWIRKLHPSYCQDGKNYYRIVVDYFGLLKVE